MTADTQHPRDSDAAEYALGTASAEERRLIERDAASDPAFALALREWQERLRPLADALPEIEPSTGLLARVEAALRTPEGATVLAFPSRDVERLRRSRSVWRGAALSAGAMAAALALWIAVPRPEGPSAPSLVAVVNRAGDLPALVVRVDPRAGLVHVRALAAETPAGRALELWSVAGGAAPRSLGLLPGGATRVALPAGSSTLADGVTLAVSVEPPGGSTTGAPTGPVVYSGRLVPDAP